MGLVHWDQKQQDLAIVPLTLLYLSAKDQNKPTGIYMWAPLRYHAKGRFNGVRRTQTSLQEARYA